MKMKKETNVKTSKPRKASKGSGGASVAAEFKRAFENNLKYRLVKEKATATDYDNYLSLAYAIRDRLVENWMATQKTCRDRKVKRVYYLSLEFLIGRTLGNSIVNLQVEDKVAEAVAEL